MSDRLLIGTRKGLFTVLRRAGGWEIDRVDFLADNVPMLLPDRRDGSIYVALALGHFGPKIHCSKDGGKTWEEIAAPAYPPKPEGASPDIDPMKGTPIPNRVELIWSLEAGGPDQPGLLWCGTVPGGLFVSKDSGKSWEIVRSLWEHPGRKEWFGGGLDWPGIHSISVDPRDSKRVAAGVSCGGVWLTKNCGETWECKADGMRAEYMPPEQAGKPGIQDPHRVVQCRSKPDSYWAQHHNGVFKTTNNLESWEEVKTVKPSVFGFAVVVHPSDANTVWLIPAVKDEKRVPVEGALVVSRTRDGGKSFDVLRDGLPQRHAYDIVFRHALDIDATGTRLAFGSTTGGLWISENQGEAWACVSAHLPPIYCVRFA